MAFITFDSERFLNSDGWNLVEHDGIELGDDYIADAVKPFIAGKREWDNYTDDVTYDVDKAMRDFMRKMKETPKWVKDRRMRTYKFSQLFRLLFGREYDVGRDSRNSSRISKVFAYYSSSIRGACKNDDGEWRAKPGYVISPRRLEKPPYSLRLRFEEMAAEGIIPTAANMRVPEDNLSKGHSRNPKTDANMERRREMKRKMHYDSVAKREAGREHNEGGDTGR